MKAFLKKWWKFCLIIVIIALVVWNRLETQRVLSTIKQYQVKRQDLKQTLTLTGTVQADAYAFLHFQTGGRLAWVGVKTGDTVQAYQGVASLDQRDVQNALEQQLNLYMKTRWDFEQLKDDKKDFIIDDRLKRILEKSQFDLNNSVLAVELRSLAVEYASLITPIAGIVTRVDMPVAGVNISSSQVIEVVNPTSVYVSVLSDQTEVTQLKAGMKADVVFDAYPSEHVEGIITSIAFSPKEGETSTVYETKLTLATTNDSYTYRLGMTADVNFITSEKKDILAVPSMFIKQDNGTKYVLKLVNNTRERTTVDLGQEADSLVEVTHGLSEGETIVEK